ncbi:sensor histidine kinase [Nocardioides nitrophenolicus]|uniref:sensor histidine kinase n=1 Tax=Nocardioides nitrophenolicus TaxID=60489 RepID=UPI00195ACCAD|nr:histidine kinase [Nocardioides nitrophenolicus]MBM7519771.1 two-component system sensor histidine kinase DesK [Nocardioides nitrophenolicus]
MSETAPTPPGTVGRRGPLFAAVWLFFLIDPIRAGLQADDRARGLTGVAATALFAAVYMLLWWRMRARAQVFGDRVGEGAGPGGALLLVLAGLSVLMMVLLGEPGVASLVYVGVAVVMVLPTRWAAPTVVAIAVTAVLLGLLPGWEFEFGVAFGVVAAAIAVFGIRTIINRNAELIAAHARNAELAVDNERTRFARDLHDILGHSLTVITIKAELAGRLFDADPERARQEITDLERLSRDALADVRRAVEGYRELTLPGELARARTALEAAQIEARLPNSTDEVPTELRELFAWTVREGVTNVVRHSGARRCEVLLGPDRAEVRDDGTGTTAALVRGSGLTGLQERAAALGARLVTTRLDPGWSLAVVVE